MKKLFLKKYIDSILILIIILIAYYFRAIISLYYINLLDYQPESLYGGREVLLDHYSKFSIICFSLYILLFIIMNKINIFLCRFEKKLFKRFIIVLFIGYLFPFIYIGSFIYLGKINEKINDNITSKVKDKLEKNWLKNIIEDIRKKIEKNGVDHKYKNGDTLLLSYIKENCFDKDFLFNNDNRNNQVIKYILSKDANPNICDDIGNSPLYYGINTNINIVRILIKHNVNVNIKDKYGENSLFWAIRSNNYDILEELLKTNLDLYIKNNENFNALHMCIWCLNLGNRNYIRKKVKKITYLLIKKGININEKDIYNRTPLMILCESKYPITPKLAKLLINKNTDLNLKNDKGKTLLDLIKENNHFKILKYIKNIKKDIN